MYLSVARDRPEGAFTRDALYNAIGAFELVREREIEACLANASGDARAADSGPVNESLVLEEGAADSSDRQTTVCQETENDRSFATAIELYLSHYPEDSDLPEIIFRQGRLYYEQGVFDAAVRFFSQLIEGYPDSDHVESAGALILDCLDRIEDYPNIERWARRLLELSAFQPQLHVAELQQSILTSIFKTGEQFAERGQHAQAAAAYLRAAVEFSQADEAPQAYFNAGLEFQRDGDMQGAADAYDRLIELYPGTEEGALGAWTAAQMFESTAQFHDAARYYEQYASRFEAHEHAAVALFNATLLRVTMGDSDAAVENGTGFLQRYRSHELDVEVRLLIGRAREQEADWSAAAELYRRLMRHSRDADRQVEASVKLARVLSEAGEMQEAGRVLQQAVALGRRLRSRRSAGLSYAAEARYLQGDRVRAEYEAIRIAGDVEGLRDRLARKSELLREAAEIYADVASFQVAEWVAAALFQIGRGYELFAESMRAAPIPDDLTEEQELAYFDQLMGFVIPMEERALEAYAGGYARAVELGIYNRWTASLREGLTRLNDIEYPPLRELGVRFDAHVRWPAPDVLDGLSRGAR
ncbi:MAG: tetratricopeptide repeat protein [Myxococcota bacterium]